MTSFLIQHIQLFDFYWAKNQTSHLSFVCHSEKIFANAKEEMIFVFFKDDVRNTFRAESAFDFSKQLIMIDDLNHSQETNISRNLALLQLCNQIS